MTPEEIRTRHYERLNHYRELPGYAESRESYEAMQAFFAQIVGTRWEIDEETYDDFLNMLPPLDWRGGVFYMMEFTFDDITTKFSKEGDRYFCEFARFPGNRETPRFSDERLVSLLTKHADIKYWEPRKQAVISELGDSSLADDAEFRLRLYELDHKLSTTLQAVRIASMGFSEATPELLASLSGQRVEMLLGGNSIFGESIKTGRLLAKPDGGFIFIPKGKRTKGFTPTYLRKA